MHTISHLSVQVRNPERVNVSVDGKYKFSLDITQVVDLGVKVGRQLDDQELCTLEEESQFGKLYGRALEYALSRPHSSREMQLYLKKKTFDRRTKEGKVLKGYSLSLVDRVLEKLQQKKYIDDYAFAHWWVENRNLTKGTSIRKLTVELKSKGVADTVIQDALESIGRNDSDELEKMIKKKQNKYDDEQKLIQYLARQGFRYEDIKEALQKEDEE